MTIETFTQTYPELIAMIGAIFIIVLVACGCFAGEQIVSYLFQRTAKEGLV